MSERQGPVPAELSKLPWYATDLCLVGVVLIALVRPFMPHGIIDYALRLADRPLWLDMGHGGSVKLVEEHPLVTGCQVQDVSWSPDGTVLVILCQTRVQAWTLDGYQIGIVSTESSLRHLQVLVQPFRVAYVGRSADPGASDPLLTIWNVQSGHSEVLPIPIESRENFVIDQGPVQFDSTHLPRLTREFRLLPLIPGEAAPMLFIASAARSMRVLPGSGGLLLGGYDGVLRKADIATGNLRELARPYTTSFPEGGEEQGSLDGLVLAPDAKSVGLFMNGGMVLPVPGTNTINRVASKKWEETLSTTVEIRSVEDGRLLDSMPGRDLGVVGLAWDPQDRFIAVAGRDALFLWHRQSGATALRTYDDPGIRHSLSISNDGARLALTTAKGVRIFRIVDGATNTN